MRVAGAAAVTSSHGSGAVRRGVQRRRCRRLAHRPLSSDPRHGPCSASPRRWCCTSTRRSRADLRGIEVPVHHVSRRRVPKQHALLEYDGYQRAKSVGAGAVGPRSRAPDAARLRSRSCRRRCGWRGSSAARARTSCISGNGVRANFDGILACWLTRTPCVCHVKGFEKYSDRERWAARHIDALVCMTEAVRGALHAARRAGPDHARRLRRRSTRRRLRRSAIAAAVRAELGIANGCAVCRRRRQHSGMEGAGGARRSHGAHRRTRAEGARLHRRWRASRRRGIQRAAQAAYPRAALG